MKQLVLFCMFLFIGLTETFAQTISNTDPGPMAYNDYVQRISVNGTINWDKDGMGHATILLPISLTNTISTNIPQPFLSYSYKYSDNIIEFIFKNPILEKTKITLNFEDENYSFGYTSNHSYFAYKWKYIIDIYF